MNFQFTENANHPIIIKLFRNCYKDKQADIISVYS